LFCSQLIGCGNERTATSQSGTKSSNFGGLHIGRGIDKLHKKEECMGMAHNLDESGTNETFRDKKYITWNAKRQNPGRSSSETKRASHWNSIWTPPTVTARTHMSQVARIDSIFAIPSQVVERFNLYLCSVEYLSVHNHPHVRIEQHWLPPTEHDCLIVPFTVV
jgi:hypothetical protein